MSRLPDTHRNWTLPGFPSVARSLASRWIGPYLPLALAFVLAMFVIVPTPALAEDGGKSSRSFGPRTPWLTPPAKSPAPAVEAMAPGDREEPEECDAREIDTSGRASGESKDADFAAGCSSDEEEEGASAQPLEETDSVPPAAESEQQSTAATTEETADADDGALLVVGAGEEGVEPADAAAVEATDEAEEAGTAQVAAVQEGAEAQVPEEGAATQGSGIVVVATPGGDAMDAANGGASTSPEAPGQPIPAPPAVADPVKGQRSSRSPGPPAPSRWPEPPSAAGPSSGPAFGESPRFLPYKMGLRIQPAPEGFRATTAYTYRSDGQWWSGLADGEPGPGAFASLSAPLRQVASREEFLKQAIDAARLTQSATGIPASVTIAQAILESNWGRSDIGANNYFGMKAETREGPSGTVWALTTEYIDGAWVSIRAPFRAYENMVQSFIDHGRFFLENRRYGEAVKNVAEPRLFARMIHESGYATDPSYSDSLLRLMDQLDLYRYDRTSNSGH